jgi:hypothetical protein
MRVVNQGFLAQAWADVDRSNRIRAARLKAGGSVCIHCFRPVATGNYLDGSQFLYHYDMQDSAGDAKNRLGIYCEGRMEAEAA